MFSIIIAALAGLLAFERQDTGAAETPVLQSTSDRVAMGRCLNGLAGARGVRMRCTLDAHGQPQGCEITNPSPAVMRNERVFQCMASKLRYAYSDGSSVEGQEIELQLGGQTVLGEEALRQAERRQAEQADQRSRP